MTERQTHGDRQKGRKKREEKKERERVSLTRSELSAEK